MPPKLRKRWIHRSAEALRNMSSSASPSASAASLGSPMGTNEVDKMDVDTGAFPIRVPSLFAHPPPDPFTFRLAKYAAATSSFDLIRFVAIPLPPYIHCSGAARDAYSHASSLPRRSRFAFAFYAVC